MRLKGSFLALLAVLSILFLAVVALAFQSAGNPQVPQGTSASFPVTGSEGTLNSEAWDVVNSTGTVIAKASLPQGWTVALSGTTFTVGSPSTAAIATNYKVRYGSGGSMPGFALHRAPSAKRATNANPSPWGSSRTGRLKPFAGGGSPPPTAGASSALFDVVAPPSPPAAPTGLTATTVSSNAINLAWTDNSVNETGFRIERKLGAAGTWAQIAVAAANATGYSDTGLAASTLYYYRVRATNGNGDSAYSNEASATTLTPTPPAAPTGLTATALSGVSVRLGWTDNANNEDGFKIYRYAGSSWPGDAGATLVGTASPNAASYVDGTVSTLTSYLYHVVAYNAAGSAGSNVASVTTPAGPPPGSRGTDFWIACPASGPTPGFHTPYPAPALLISNDGASAANVVVTVPGLAFTQSVVVASMGTMSVTLPIEAEATSADGVQAIGTRVVSDQPVSVHVFQNKIWATDGFLALPVGTLGKEHVLPSYPANAAGDMNSRFAVAASADATTITVVPAIAVGPRAARIPYVVTLNQGDVYELKTLVAGADLTGTVVTADKPIAVVSGDQGTMVPNPVSAANPLTETVPSVDRWGLQFVAVPYATRASDLLRIVAARNGTQVSVDGVLIATLDRGGFVDRDLSAACAISSNKPILVEQLSKGCDSDGNQGADPFMTTVPALSQYAASAAWTTPASSAMDVNFVNVVVPSGGVGDLRLDGVVVPSASFTTLGSTGYAYARLSVAAGAAHRLATPATGQPFGAWAYGFQTAQNSPMFDGYGYPASQALPITPGFVWTPPTPASSLTATAISTSAINLAWTDAASDMTGFRIERKTGAGGSWAPLTTVGASIRAYADTGLAKATTYVYRVVATNDLDAAPSNEASATTFDTPPNAPTNPVATALSATTIDVAWTDASDNETGFFVERKQGAGAYGAPVQIPANTTVFHDTGLTKKTAYTYRVTAKNAYGNSAPSPEATATTKDTPPAAPTALTAASSAYNQVVLNWTDNADNETGFKVERSLDGTTWNQIYSYNAVNITTFVDNTVQGATAYWYRVRMYNDGGDSDYSNVATVTTQSPPIPSAPTGLTATAVSSSQIRLDWTNTSGVQTSVAIQRKGGANPNWADVGSVSGGTTNWTDSALTAQTTYTYQIRSTNVSGSSAWAGPASATTKSASADVPVEVTAAATGANSITLYWQGYSGAIGYNAYRSTSSSGSYTRVNASPITSTDPGPGVVNGFMYTDNSLVSGQEYFYKIAPVLTSGGAEGPLSDWSNDVPSSRAVPWNTGNAPQIVSKVNYEDQFDSPAWGSDGWTLATGPNGVVYMSHLDGSAPTAVASAAQFDNDANLVVPSDGSPSYPWVTDSDDGLDPDQSTASLDMRRLVAMRTNDPIESLLTLPAQGVSTNVRPYPRTKIPSGIFRKVEAAPGHYHFTATTIFPGSTSGLSQTSATKDTACVYTGGEGGPHALDIGFQKGSDAITGWQIVTLASYNGKKYKAFEPKDKITGTSTSYASVRAVGAARMDLTIPSPSGLAANTALFVADAPSAGGYWSVTGGNAQTRVPSKIRVHMRLRNFDKQTYQQFRFKRVNSIAQHLVGFKGATVAADAPNTRTKKGYKANNVQVRFAQWGSAEDEDVCVKIDGSLLTRDVNAVRAGAYFQNGRVVSWRATSGLEYYFEDMISLTCQQP